VGRPVGAVVGAVVGTRHVVGAVVFTFTTIPGAVLVLTPNSACQCTSLKTTTILGQTQLGITTLPVPLARTLTPHTTRKTHPKYA